MAKVTPKSTASIQRLLDERAQVQRWVERLEMAGDAAPEQVRSRVRRDYANRLAEIIRELEGHTQELTSTLERLQSVGEGLRKQESEAAERVAEAELRHAVGEYEETQWRQVHAALLGELVKVREELKQSDEEIARVEEVVDLISGAGRARPEPEPEPEPVRARTESPAPSRKADPPRKDAPDKPPTRQRDAFDELAFLRSVTEDEQQGPKASRASGAMRAVFNEPVVPTQSVPSPDMVEQPADTTPRQSKSVKSLKCQECGTLNLPTEWYCERCGAELAAL
ncbi:MAG TPA: hypothetical protein VD793_09165 [Gemmatimonadales bacterium]|nr:hypothetical protein [Gemmatimonadales bacterium]